MHHVKCTAVLCNHINSMYRAYPAHRSACHVSSLLQLVDLPSRPQLIRWSQSLPTAIIFQDEGPLAIASDLWAEIELFPLQPFCFPRPINSFSGFFIFFFIVELFSCGFLLSAYSCLVQLCQQHACTEHTLRTAALESKTWKKFAGGMVTIPKWVVYDIVLPTLFPVIGQDSFKQIFSKCLEVT